MARFLNKALFPPYKRFLLSYLQNTWVENPLNACEAAEECIICGCSGSKLAQCKDISSWTTLYRAAVIRNHTPILEAPPESEFLESIIKYHRNCRAEFINKRDLQTNNKPSDDAATGTCIQKNPQIGNQPNSAILPDQCLFCKKSKYKPNTKTKEKLHNVQEVCADDLNDPYPANYMIRYRGISAQNIPQPINFLLSALKFLPKYPLSQSP